MPNFKQLPEAVITEIADKLGKSLSVEFALGGPAPSVSLHESIEIWMLGASSLTEPTNDLRQLCVRTGRWHHQVKVGNAPKVFANSMSKGPNPSDWEVVQYASSPIAAGVDDAISWIDTNITKDGEVRLLVAPAFHVYAFWIIHDDGDQSIVIVDAPLEYKTLVKHKTFTSLEFLDELRSVRHITGLEI